MINANEAKENVLDKKFKDKELKDSEIKEVISFINKRIEQSSKNGKSRISMRYFKTDKGSGFRIQVTDGHANTLFYKEEITSILLELGYTISDRNNNFQINW